MSSKVSDDAQSDSSDAGPDLALDEVGEELIIELDAEEDVLLEEHAPLRMEDIDELGARPPVEPIETPFWVTQATDELVRAMCTATLTRRLARLWHVALGVDFESVLRSQKAAIAQARSDLQRRIEISDISRSAALAAARDKALGDVAAHAERAQKAMREIAKAVAPRAAACGSELARYAGEAEKIDWMKGKFDRAARVSGKNGPAWEERIREIAAEEKDRALAALAKQRDDKLSSVWKAYEPIPLTLPPLRGTDFESVDTLVTACGRFVELQLVQLATQILSVHASSIRDFQDESIPQT